MKREGKVFERWQKLIWFITASQEASEYDEEANDKMWDYILSNFTLTKKKNKITFNDFLEYSKQLNKDKNE